MDIEGCKVGRIGFQFPLRTAHTAMSIFGFSKGHHERPEWVMAYLDEARDLQFQFTLINPEGTRVPAYLAEMDEEAGFGEWRLEGPLFAEKGDLVAMTVVFGELRIGASLKVLETRARAVILELPVRLELAEQRKALRAKLSTLEAVDFTALTGLYEGLGVLGYVENISSSGVRLRISKALMLKTQAPVRLVPTLLAPGQPLVVLKLKKLPKCPSTLDFSGEVVYIESCFRNLYAGVKFAATPADSAEFLDSFLAKRVGELPESIPEKARRKPLKPVEKPGSKPFVTPPSILPEAELAETLHPEPDPSPVTEIQATPQANTAMLRLKKRGRTIAVVASGDRGESLQNYLQQDGYGKILLAQKPSEIMEMTRQHSVHLVFLDCMASLIQSLDVLAGLRRELPEGVPLVVAVDDIAVSRSPKVQNLGVQKFVAKPYRLDAAFAETLERILGLR